MAAVALWRGGRGPSRPAAPAPAATTTPTPDRLGGPRPCPTAPAARPAHI
ncbi:hypothetical protein ACFQ60_13090 [Streptomyces zhihengii]